MAKRSKSSNVISPGQRKQPAHTTGTPFQNSLVETFPPRNRFLPSDNEPAVHSQSSRKPGKTGGTGVPSVGKLPSSPPKGGLGKITPSKGKP